MPHGPCRQQSQGVLARPHLPAGRPWVRPRRCPALAASRTQTRCRSTSVTMDEALCELTRISMFQVSKGCSTQARGPGHGWAVGAAVGPGGSSETQLQAGPPLCLCKHELFLPNLWLICYFNCVQVIWLLKPCMQLTCKSSIGLKSTTIIRNLNNALVNKNKGRPDKSCKCNLSCAKMIVEKAFKCFSLTWAIFF